ncbi:CHAD domain-containing protein [Micromonospora sp. DT4]|uniref:CHAD domain-containing protein n=1 Tax=Micromonospora sp. DT4 TaxID=3393438 RepID=UPI003CFAF4D4
MLEEEQKYEVACRRLRSDLRTFRPLVRRSWARPLRDELRWLAGVLGEARDAEVLRERLRRTATADPLSPLDAGAVDRLDDRWHAVRKEGKQARYAVTAVLPAVGKDARRLARALARVQDVLGEHQDAAVAAETWLSLAAERPDDHEVAVTAGRLAERERDTVHLMRARLPDAWHRATRRRRTRWLP